MKSMTRVLLLGGLAVFALAAVACSSGSSEGEADVAASIGIDPPAGSLPVNPDHNPTTIEPTDPGVVIEEPDGPVKEPGELTLITSLDLIDQNKCDFIHAINACFTEGALPDDIFPGEVMELYFDARDMLAEALGVDPSTAKITNIKRADWPDASLGVSEPGMSYIQVITPGFKMVMELEPDGTQYVFHTSTSRVVPEQPIQ